MPAPELLLKVMLMVVELKGAASEGDCSTLTNGMSAIKKMLKELVLFLLPYSNIATKHHLWS